MSDLIDRQQAIDDIWTVSPLASLDREWIDRWLRQLPPAQLAPSQVAADIARIVENGQDMRVIEAAQPTPDKNGDLWITVPDIDEVTCIYVQESKSKFCRIFYEEKEQPERIVRCKDCKYWIPYDWMFSEVWRSKNMADYSEDEIGCNYCDMTMKANDFCSRAERKEVTE